MLLFDEGIQGFFEIFTYLLRNAGDNQVVPNAPGLGVKGRLFNNLFNILFNISN